MFFIPTGNYSRLACEIQFVRSMGYYLIQIYIPSGLIVIISLGELLAEPKRHARPGSPGCHHRVDHDHTLCPLRTQRYRKYRTSNRLTYTWGPVSSWSSLDFLQDNAYKYHMLHIPPATLRRIFSHIDLKHCPV
ncbi:hypothetical protein NQ317_014614 [Molorchus minor]|uniref:Uncharacterized protein n=1 Tax=Molorchus minor TaxID=1323400 RepID=A0ABQ9JPT5_9CUCU|nr:hypothetical protein NQ317_014614 [Molorchus minor]